MHFCPSERNLIDYQFEIEEYEGACMLLNSKLRKIIKSKDKFVEKKATLTA